MCRPDGRAPCRVRVRSGDLRSHPPACLPRAREDHAAPLAAAGGLGDGGLARRARSWSPPRRAPGKTVPALARRPPAAAHALDRAVAVVCPTAPLTRQWAAAAARMGLQLAPDAANLRPPSGFDGVAVTYARVAQSGARWAKQCSPGTFVIADEAHHLGDELAWGQGFNAAFAGAARWLLLSGTPFRSDAAPIPGVRYDSDGIAVPDVAYSYADAVRDGVCRPVTFVPYDGVLQWQSGEETIEASFADAVHSREAARRYRTAISVELADGLPRILAAAHEKLLSVREAGHRDAGGLVVAADGEHARAVAKALRAVTGKPPIVVLHTEARAAEKLAAFRDGREPWIVAVNMVSEGVDIPRLRVGVYATAAKTPLIFRQIVGRFVRTIPGRGLDMSWLYLPADPVLRGHAADVENDLSPILRRLGLVDDELLDEIAGSPRDRAVRVAGIRPARRRPVADAADGAVRAARRRPGADADVRLGDRGPARRPVAPGLRAPRAPARQAPPPRLRPAPDRRPDPRRDQLVAQPRDRHHARRRRLDRPARALDRAAARHPQPLPLRPTLSSDSPPWCNG